jgi:hypothetical protein
LTNQTTSKTETTTYGTCPNGHGDENGEIAAEVSADARPYPNCPICGYALEDTYEIEREITA